MAASIVNINPASLGGEPAVYSQAKLVSGAEQTLYISGQVGFDEHGNMSSDKIEQTRQAWLNIEAILAEAGMAVTNIVKTTTFVVDNSDYHAFVEARRAILKDHKPASTLAVVASLHSPDWKVEIEVIAVK